MIQPKTIPHARDYKGPWDSAVEKRCADCGTAKGHIYLSSWGDEICVCCAANRLGA